MTIDAAEAPRWIGWHFLEHPDRLRNGQPAGKAGDVEEWYGELKLCPSDYDIACGYGGLHACKSPTDVLNNNPGGWTLRQVELLGPRLDEPDKSCARRRRVLRVLPADAVRLVVLYWAIDCAETILPYAGARRQRISDCLAVVRRFVAGEANVMELQLARSMLYDAEGHRASASAAWAAAYAYAARAAARAAYAAARDAASAARAAACVLPGDTEVCLAVCHCISSLEQRLLSIPPLQQ